MRDVQAFLGFANFYQCFTHGYLEITLPLTRLTWKDVSWNWSDSCERTFNDLKRAFTSASILMHWDPEAKIIVETDTSDAALATILSTYKGDKLHPIAFHSRSFQTAERNYDVHNKELLAIFKAFKRWHHYLEGTPSPVEVITDHRNSEYFCKSKSLTRRQAHWSEFLSQFNLKICFRLGKLRTKPDTLTQRWNVYPGGGTTLYTNGQFPKRAPIIPSQPTIPSAQSCPPTEPETNTGIYHGPHHLDPGCHGHATPGPTRDVGVHGQRTLL